MAVINSYICILIVMAVLAKTEAQSVRPADVTAFQGQQVTFNCSGSYVYWNYVEDLPQAPTKIFASPNTWFREKGTKYDIIGEYYLVVNDVQADSDAGIYQCDTNEFAASVLQTKLVVIDDISMTVSPGGQLMRGMTIAVSCRIRYQGPKTLSSEQELALMLSFADGQPLPSGNTYYQPPSVGDTFQRKTLEVNYTITEATPKGKLRCTVTSLAYQGIAEEMLLIKSAPEIDRISLGVKVYYNRSDTITCSAEGVPSPTVTWIHISGSMPANRRFTGQGKADLWNLESGDHTWMCIAANTEGSDNYTLSFTVAETGERSTDGCSGGSSPSETLVIVIVVVAGAVIIVLIIVVGVVYLYRRRARRNAVSDYQVPSSLSNQVDDHQYSHYLPPPSEDTETYVNANVH